MKVIGKNLTDLGNDQYYIKHLQIINPLLPDSSRMTPKELEVLAAFMALSGDLIKKNRFNTVARKVVMDNLGISTGGLGNYLKTLREKKMIFKNSYDVYEISGFLIPEESKQGYKIAISK